MRRSRCQKSLFACALFGLLSSGLAAQEVHLPPITRVQLENRTQVLLMEYHRAPTLTIIAQFHGGSVNDPAKKAGVAALMMNLLRKGTEKRTAVQIAEESDFLGGSLNAAAGEERLTLTLDTLVKDADPALDLLMDVIRHPTFPAAEVERERALEISDLQGIGEDPGQIADRTLTETIYAHHPYGVFPTITSLKNITRQDILDAYRRLIDPNRLVLIAVGDFHTDVLLAKLKSRFADWSRRAEGLAGATPPPLSAPRIVLIDKPDATQTQVRFGRTTMIWRNNADYFPAMVASAILGGGFTSRLVDEIRVNRSLTYGIGSSFQGDPRGGRFDVSTFTKIETTGALLDATKTVLQQAADKGFSDAELEKFKRYLAGAFAISVQRPQRIASEIADIAFYALPDDYLQTYLEKLRAVSLMDVNRVAHIWFQTELLSVALVAPAAKVRPQLKSLGKMEVHPAESIGK